MKGFSKLFQNLFGPRDPPKHKIDPKTEQRQLQWLKMREQVFHEKLQELLEMIEKYGLEKNDYKRADVPKDIGSSARIIFILIVRPDDFARIVNDMNIARVDMLFPDFGIFLEEMPRMFQVPLDEQRLIRMITIANFQINDFFQQLWNSLNYDCQQLQGKSTDLESLRKYFFEKGLYFDIITGKNLIMIPVGSVALQSPEKPILIIEKRELPADE